MHASLKLLACASICAVMSWAGAPARATIISQTVDVSSQSIFSHETGSLSGYSFDVPVTFNQVSSSEGTVTGVSYTYDYVFQISAGIADPDGGAGVDVGGDFEVNDNSGESFGGLFGGGSATSPNSSTFDVADTEPYTLGAFSPLVGSGTYNLDFVGATNGGEAINTFASLSVISGTVTAYYSIIPAVVPEPKTWAMAAIILPVVGLFVWKNRARAAR